MSAHAETPGHGGPPAGYGAAGHLDRVMMGLIVALASEIMLFGAFFTAFFYVRYTNYPVYPPEPFEMPVDSTGINTAILVSSSFTMHWALVSVKRGNRRGLTLGLLFTLIMGFTFLALQIREYNLLHTEGFTPEHGAFASVFFALTGLHGIHVLVGAILIAIARADAAGPLLAREAHGRGAVRHLLALRRRRLGRAVHARLPALERRSSAPLGHHSGAARPRKAASSERPR
jgi:cytochrome c oxidase subunit 3